MKQLLTLILIFLAAGSFQLSAQNFEVPEFFDPNRTTDFRQYNKDIVGAVNWLENTPVDQETEKRKKVNGFLLKWVTGSPDVSISIKSNVITFSERNPELLAIYMGAWTKYAIESGDYKDSIKANLAAIKSVLKVYKANKSMTKDKEVEKLIGLEKKGELEKWEEDQMK